MDKDGRLFSGYEYFLTHNDGDVTLDGIIAEMDGYVSRQGIHYTSEEIKEKVEEVENKISHLGMTIDKYRLSGEKKTAVYTQEREALHEKIIKEIVINRATSKMLSDQPCIMLMLCGRPGSGKTSSFRGLAYDENFIVLDADEIKAMLPEYKGWNAEEVHEESGDILEQCVQACKRNHLNVVIETTMGKADSVLRRIREFHEDGYKVEAHYMFLPMRAAGRRAMERFLNGGENGRYMPIGVLQQMDKIKFYGPVPANQTADFYRMADACLLTLNGDNLIGHTLPGKVQTYMAAGKTILGAINGAGQEVIKKSGCGLCVNAGDVEGLANSMSFFIQKKNQFVQCGEKAREYFLENFMLSQHFSKLEMILEGLKNRKI